MANNKSFFLENMCATFYTSFYNAIRKPVRGYKKEDGSMTEEKLNEYYSCGEIIPKEAHMQSHEQSIKAQKITMEMNSCFHTPEELNELFSELTGKKVTDISIFPPFYTDYGKNIL